MNTPTILRKIIQRKHEEVALRRTRVSESALQECVAAKAPTRGFIRAIERAVAAGSLAVIAEIKKASPSKGVIRDPFIPVDIAHSYADAGATCLSVLTDVDFFQGSDQYLVDVRQAVSLPVLRKDFIIDEYQLYEARAMGADCVLLIVAALSFERLSQLNQLAQDLGLDVLVEVHDEKELQEALKLPNRLIGINNRNLHTFETRLDTTYKLLSEVGSDRIVVTESGIHTTEQVQEMQNRGVNSFLVGEAFMREKSPGEALQKLFATTLASPTS